MNNTQALARRRETKFVFFIAIVGLVAGLIGYFSTSPSNRHWWIILLFVIGMVAVNYFVNLAVQFLDWLHK